MLRGFRRLPTFVPQIQTSATSLEPPFDNFAYLGQAHLPASKAASLPSPPRSCRNHLLLRDSAGALVPETQKQIRFAS